MKQIVINGRFLTQGVTGVQRYAAEVVFAMDQMLADGELEQPKEAVELLKPPHAPFSRPLHYMKPRIVGWGNGQAWEQLCLPLFSAGKLLFTPCGGAPLLHATSVFTIPDAGVFATPKAYSWQYGTWYRLHHRLAAHKRRLHFLTVSEFSQAELARSLRIDRTRLQVTPEGHEHALSVDADNRILQHIGVRRKGYILGVGSRNPNKNFDVLRKAYRELRSLIPEETWEACPLVLVGGGNESVFRQEHLADEGVIQAGYVTDAQLRALYESAACFVFPSLYEGFGLPVLEAMALGCPVVCSNVASLPEVCGPAALMVDPRDPVALADGIAQVLQDVALRARMVDLGFDRVKLYRWKQTARLTWGALIEAASKP